MANGAVSFRDPAVASTARAVEARLGLPTGLLQAIILHGEKSNHDQVSSAGARGVAQIIPSTRKAALKQFGIDAYASLENNIEVAGRLLQDSLARNRGDVREAVAEYHAGTDPKARGPVNRAYVGRVMTALGQPSGRGASTFDRVKARRAQERPQGPSIAAIYDAYRAGKMTPQEKAEFEADVEGGAIMLPRGAKLDAAPKAPVLPLGVVEAHNNHSEMSDAERGQLERDVAEGLVALPPGTKLTRPAPRTAGDQIGMGVRNLAEGAGELADFIASPVRGAINAGLAAAGSDARAQPITEAYVKPGAEALGLPEAATPAEKLAASIQKGGVQALGTTGAGVLLSGAKGLAGGVGKALADAPIKNAVAGAAGGGAAEKARQEGAGPVGQMAAGIVGGLGAYGSAAAIERGVARHGAKTAAAVAKNPPEAVFDDAGELTEHGREVAARAGVSREELKAAYDDAIADAGDAPAAAVADDPVPAAGARTAGDGETAVLERPIVEAVEETPSPAAAAPEGPLPAGAAARLEEAASENVALTRGQATQDFATQDAEQTLKASPTPQGDKARQFAEQQQAQIQAATERYKQAFGSPDASAAERGQMVKDALSELRDNGKAGVDAMYGEARRLSETMGENAGSNSAALLDLDTADLQGRMRELLIDEVVPADARNGLRQLAAQYGLIGRGSRVLEDGTTLVEIADASGKVGRTIELPRPVQKLSVVNAESFRKGINDLYRTDTSGRSQSLKGVIDDAVEAAIERAAMEGVGNVGGAFKAARSAFREQKATFEAKDVVQALIDKKKNTSTDLVLPEDAIKKIFAGGKDGVSNLKKVKAVLLNKPTAQSRAAWKAIQAHGVADIFDKALSPRGEISGARLDSAMKKFGDDKLRILLEPADYNQLQKLRRIIKNATVPLAGTTNPSGSGYKVISFLAQQASRLGGLTRFVPGVGPLVDSGVALAKGAHAAGQAEKTLKGVREFDQAAAVKADAKAAQAGRRKLPDGAAFVRQFIDTANSDALLKSVMAGALNTDEDQ